MPEKKRRYSLRGIVSILGGIIFIFSIIAFFCIVQISMQKILMKSENEYAILEIDIANEALRTNAHEIARSTKCLAYGANPGDIGHELNPGYINHHWSECMAPQGHETRLAVVKNYHGDDLYVNFYDESGSIDAPEGFTHALNGLSSEIVAQYEISSLNGHNADVGQNGIMIYQGIAYHISIMPIVIKEAPTPVGTVIFGSILNDSSLKEFTRLNTTQFEITDMPDDVISDTDIRLIDHDIVSVKIPMKDIYDNDIILKMDSERTIYTDGYRMTVIANCLLAAVAIALIAVTAIMISHIVLRPIEQLNKDIIGLSTEGQIDTSKYGGIKEFHTLCLSINDMRAKLNESVHLLEKTSVSMNVIQSILDGIDALVYVSDAENDDILYINDKMKKHYDLERDIVGKTCWKMLQSGMTERCSFCPMHTLAQNPDEIISWEEHSTVTGRYYRNTDCLIHWAEGKLAHLQHSVDITEIKNTQNALDRRLGQQELMSTMSQSFISLNDMEELINNALCMAGEFMNIGKITLASLNKETHELNYKYEWCNEAQNIVRLGKDAYPFAPGETMYDAFITQKLPYSINVLTRDDDKFSSLRREGIKSFLSIPVYVSGALWGVINFDEHQADREWTESDIQLTKMIANVISGVVVRNETEANLIRMSSIVDSSPAFVAYVDTSGRFQYINQGTMDLTGYTQEELLQGNIEMLFKDEISRYIRDNILSGDSEEGTHVLELPLIRKDCAERIVSISIFATNLRSLGFGMIASDITEKKQMEKDLIAAKEQAESASQAKGEFLARMSHEMRTPMNAIIGMTTIAKSSPELERKEYCLIKIEDASKHLLGIINDVLDMSKIEANKFELSHAEFDMEKMLLRVINVINFRLEEKHQKFVVNLDRNMPQFFIGDDQRLAQIIANLLSNAVKFTPEYGAITLAVRVVNRRDDTYRLKISVEDTGIGISPQQQQKLFASFEQADGSISRKYGGTGLGLAISKKIVELMGGNLWVVSKVGEGSAFTFEIELKKGPSVRLSLLSADINWKNLKILAVDDSEDTREYFQNIIGSLGLTCDVASGGKEALELIERAGSPYNIIFVDWKMPGMDGIELTRRIKAYHTKNTVVIMVSAVEWTDVEQDAKAAGVDRFMPKPLFSSLMVDCINECLSLDPHREEASEDATHDYSGKILLLAEDVDINREIVSALLEDTGIKIDYAQNGIEARDMFMANPERYGMIFMDIHMPEMDGLEATRQIRALTLPRAQTIPIVAMTANVFREDVEMCFAVGMNDHVGKPIEREDMLKAMDKYLGAV